MSELCRNTNYAIQNGLCFERKQTPILPLLGRSSRRLGNIHASPQGAWSPDGKEILYARSNSLFRVGIDGANSRKIADVPTGEKPYKLRWSPDGSRLRFTAGTSLWEVGADGKNIHRLFRTGLTPSHGATEMPELAIQWSSASNSGYFLAVPLGPANEYSPSI